MLGVSATVEIKTLSLAKEDNVPFVRVGPCDWLNPGEMLTIVIEPETAYNLTYKQMRKETGLRARCFRMCTGTLTMEEVY